jgi:hypothetical protein
MGIDNHRKQMQVFRMHNKLDKFLFSAKVLEFIKDSGEIKRLIL